MTQESNALLHRVKERKRISIGGMPAWEISLSGQSCMLITSGMGAKRASQAARILVENFAPSSLISFGIGGAVEADLEIGDVVLPEAYCRFDEGTMGELKPLTPWPASARLAASQELARHGRQLYVGTAVTTRGSQVISGQLGSLKHPVLEMETAGIAQVAGENGIPLLSLRSISDGPRAPIPLDLSEVMDEDANLNMIKMIQAVMRQPKIILQSRLMLKNTQIAADNAALALIAALSKLSDN